MKLIQFCFGNAKIDQIIIGALTFYFHWRGHGGKNLGDHWSEFPWRAKSHKRKSSEEMESFLPEQVWTPGIYGSDNHDDLPYATSEF